MGVRAICRNCEREMALMQDGLCGGCFNRRAKGLKNGNVESALAQAREDFKGRGPVGPGNRKPRKPKVEGKAKRDPAGGAISAAGVQDPGGKVEGKAPRPDVSTPVSTRKPDPKLLPPRLVNPSIISIMVNFTDRDDALFDSLQALSRKFRRSPDQQILWMLEQGIDYFNNLHGEEVAHG